MDWQQLWSNHLRIPVLLTLLVKVILVIFLVGTHGFIGFSMDQYRNNSQFRSTQDVLLEDPEFTRGVPFMFSHFDAQWYMQIARDGYNPQGVTVEPKNVAFYPLYPAMIWLGSLVVDTSWSAWLWSTLWTFTMAVLMYAVTRTLARRWGLEEQQELQMGFLATMLLLLHPMGVFFMASYTESLFLTLMLGGLLAAWKDRPWLAGLLGMLATLTKVQGLLLLPIFLLAVWEARAPRKLQMRDIWLLLIPAGMILWCGYMWYVTGNPFASFDVQKVFGMGRPGGLNPAPLLETLQKLTLWHSYRNSPYDVAATVATAGILAMGWKRLSWSLRLLGFVFLLLPLMSWSIMSMGRYVLLVFPATILLAWWSIRRPLLQTAVVSISILLCSLFAVMYTHHFWVG